MDEATRLQSLIVNRVNYVDTGFTSPCWISNRSSNGRGHTKMGVRGVMWLTHRLAYTLWIGPIPDGLQLDHLCRQRACCNPGHLEPVTCRTNLMRGLTLTASEAAQTHCLRGHLLAGANLYHRPDYPSKRECRSCRNTARHRRALRRT